MAVVVNPKAVKTSFKGLRARYGSALIGFIQAGTDAVRRSLQDKNRDFVNTRDFRGGLSASKTGAQNSAVLQAAINALGSNDVPTFLYVQDGDFTFADDITINKVCTLYFGKGTYTLDNCSIVIGGEKSVELRGQSAKQTTIKGTTASQVLIRYTGLNSGSDSLGTRATVIAHLCLHGNSVAASGVVIPTTQSGVFTMANGRTVIESVCFARFAGTAYVAGESVYFQYFARCQFDYNDIGVDIDRQTDTTFFECLFGPHTAAGLKSGGTQQRYTECSFTLQEGTAPDIWLTCDQAFGTVQIGPGCYFGNEGDNAGHVNILIDSSDGQQVASDIKIIDNWFYGDSGQTAIRIDTPVDAMVVTGNQFKGYTTIIDDVQDQVTGVVGGGTYRDNIISNYSAEAVTVFTNGGRNFELVEYPPQSGGITVPARHFGELQNRARYSTDMVTTVDAYHFVKSTGLTVTSGEADSKGGTDAFLLTRDGASSGQSMNVRIDVTDLLTDDGTPASGYTGRVVLKCEMQAGTLGYAVVACRDATNGRTFAKRIVKLDTAWKEYTFVFTGINPANQTRIYIYPGSDNSATAGTMRIAFFGISDFGSEYVATAGAMASYTGSQSRELMFTTNLTPAAVAANTSAEQTFVVTGLLVGDVVSLNPPGLTAGTGIVGWRVSADDELKIAYANFTGGSLTPASGNHLLTVSRA